jgi:hypothetical protein
VVILLLRCGLLGRAVGGEIVVVGDAGGSAGCEGVVLSGVGVLGEGGVVRAG